MVVLVDQHMWWFVGRIVGHGASSVRRRDIVGGSSSSTTHDKQLLLRVVVVAVAGEDLSHGNSLHYQC